MAIMSVDTLSIARELRAADMPQAQAEAVAAAIWTSINEGTATKSDIALVRSELTQVKFELEAKIEALQSKLVMWMIGSQITVAAVIIAAIKL